MFIPLENKENNEAELERKKQCNLLCTLLWSLFLFFKLQGAVPPAGAEIRTRGLLGKSSLQA
jgi:hypothetical protein